MTREEFVDEWSRMTPNQRSIVVLTAVAVEAMVSVGGEQAADGQMGDFVEKIDIGAASILFDSYNLGIVTGALAQAQRGQTVSEVQDGEERSS